MTAKLIKITDPLDSQISSGPDADMFLMYVERYCVAWNKIMI